MQQLEIPALPVPTPRVEGEATPALALQFDIHDRLKRAKVDYERGKALLVEVEAEMQKAAAEFNERRRTIATELMRIEGAISLLLEQGAKDE